jgi:hypothetical protein
MTATDRDEAWDTMLDDLLVEIVVDTWSAGEILRAAASRHLRSELPEDASHRALAERLVAVFHERGLLDRAFFVALQMRCPGHRRDDLDTVAGSRGVTLAPVPALLPDVNAWLAKHPTVSQLLFVALLLAWIGAVLDR